MSTPPPQSQSQDQQPQPQPQLDKAQRTAEAKAAFTASLNSVGSNLDSDLRARAATIHENASALEKQQDDLQRSTKELSKQNDSWQKVADMGREGLKEVGDVQNWAELIERDLLVLEETVRLAEERKEGEVEVEEGREGEDVVMGNGDGKSAEGDGKSGWKWWW